MKILYMGCNDVTKFDVISGSHVVGQVYMYLSENNSLRIAGH